jgi:hypothetical protein
MYYPRFMKSRGNEIEGTHSTNGGGMFTILREITFERPGRVSEDNIEIVGFAVQFAAYARDFSPFHSVQADFGAYLSYPVRNGASFSRVKSSGS